MFDPQTLWSLPAPQASRIHEFIFHPAAYIHPQRLAAIWPGSADRLPADGRHDAALSAALMAEFDLSDGVDVDVYAPLHQAAMLSPSELQQVAHAGEVLALAPHLRRIILRSELQVLAAQISRDDWDLVFGSAPSRLVEDDAQSPMGLTELMRAFGRLGWQLLDAAFTRLPDSVSRRACLKLPPLGDRLPPSRIPWALAIVEEACQKRLARLTSSEVGA